jgi:hypothetical protein
MRQPQHPSEAETLAAEVAQELASAVRDLQEVIHWGVPWIVDDACCDVQWHLHRIPQPAATDEAEALVDYIAARAKAGAGRKALLALVAALETLLEGTE